MAIDKTINLIARIKALSWKKGKKYGIMGGYNEEFIADNGDKIILSTCATVSTKYVIDGKESSIFGEEESYIYKEFW